MKIEVDQSGKVEQLDTLTIVAGANGESHAVYISAGAKRKITQALRKTLLPQKEIWPVVFSILVFKLLTLFKTLPTIVEVDEEYTGKSEVVEETVSKLFDKKRKPQILCKQVGKHSNAHILAWRIHRLKKKQFARVITEREILNLWRQKSRP